MRTKKMWWKEYTQHQLRSLCASFFQDNNQTNDYDDQNGQQRRTIKTTKIDLDDKRGRRPKYNEGDEFGRWGTYLALTNTTRFSNLYPTKWEV